ncbi:DUF4405 domain-containing protein [Rhizobium sp. BK060]|uniref:DUF4405 domain-containing protein n=1 Tax=Rhizobium sp. BK060 TaxID=2587096 RepID=UPI001FEF1437|nr:DUF4405 domain-containing protein [Rhizobium sp. BK060]
MAVSLLVAAMAYDWLGNAVHEIFGTVMFVLLVSHNIFNRRWFSTIAKSPREPRAILVKTINLSLLVAILALLVTSVMISQTIFSFLPLRSTFTARQIHALVAYLVLFIGALHLGLQWSRIMRIVNGWVGIKSESRSRTFLLRGAAILLAAYGVRGLFVIDVRSKLLMEPNLNFWDFETAAGQFLLHHVAIVGLYALVAHYSLRMVDLWKSRRGRLAHSSN